MKRYRQVFSSQTKVHAKCNRNFITSYYVRFSFKKVFYQRKILDMFKIHSRFFVTLTLEPICETVPLHVLGHNFLFCGWNLKSDIPKWSVCQMLHFRCICESWIWFLSSKKLKKLKMLVWQAKFGSGLTFFWKLHKWRTYRFYK